MLNVIDSEPVSAMAHLPLPGYTQPLSDHYGSDVEDFLVTFSGQFSRYLSQDSWLLSEVKSWVLTEEGQPVSGVSQLPQELESVAPLLPLNLAVALESLWEFGQTSSITPPQALLVPVVGIEGEIGPVKPASQVGVSDWVAIAEVRVLPAPPETSGRRLSSYLLGRCTDLPAAAHVPQSPKAKSLPRFEVWLKDQLIGEVSTAAEAEQLSQLLRQALRQRDLAPNELYPVLTGSRPAIRLDSTILFYVNTAMAEDLGYSPEWVAVNWSNNLRQALAAEALDAGSVQMAIAGFEESEIHLQGLASWYGPYFHGRLTATGEIFNQNELTVAHKTLPFGTQLKVRNLENNRTVVVRVNDRGPYIGIRSLDLSKAAAQCLGSEYTGVIRYEATILEEAIPQGTIALVSQN